MRQPNKEKLMKLHTELSTMETDYQKYSDHVSLPTRIFSDSRLFRIAREIPGMYK